MYAHSHIHFFFFEIPGFALGLAMVRLKAYVHSIPQICKESWDKHACMISHILEELSHAFACMIFDISMHMEHLYCRHDL